MRISSILSVYGFEIRPTKYKAKQNMNIFKATWLLKHFVHIYDIKHKNESEKYVRFPGH